MNISEYSTVNTVNKSIEGKIIAKLLGNEDYLVYVFNKTERIVSAIYLVTNLLTDFETIKYHIRQKCSELVPLTIKAAHTNLFQRRECLLSMLSIMIEVKTYLSVLTRSGAVSEMNFIIINDEIVNLLSIVNSLETNPVSSEAVSLGKEYFTFDELRNSDSPDFREDANTKPTNEVRNTPIKAGEIAEVPFIKDVQKDKSSSRVSEVNDKRDLRKKLILSLISRKGIVTVSDVAKIIKDCSEKTIQREMQHMADSDVLEKSGERRWTRYFLPKKQ